jgi:hypothetical protein
MANQGWPNDAGSGVQVSSTARQSGRGEQVGAFDDFVDGERDFDPGQHCDPLSQKSDQVAPYAIRGPGHITLPMSQG